MHYWHGTHLAKDTKHVTWNKHKILGKTKGYNENMDKILDSAFKTNEKMNFKSTRKDKTRVVIGSLRYHEPINIPFCEDYKHNQK